MGSGFDISSAVYGSQIYTRFSKSVIRELLEEVEAANITNANNQKQGSGDGPCLSLTESSSQKLLSIVNDTQNQWDSTATPVTLPPGLELLMADVCGGSESPSMATKILNWKKNHRQTGFMDDYYWKDLKRCNRKICSLLQNELASQSIRDGLRRDRARIIANRTAEQWKKPMPSSSWDVATKLYDLRMTFLECRQNLKGMGKAAGKAARGTNGDTATGGEVPVEPDEQTALANATMKLPGVVAAGVPVAGGYDSLCVIYVKGPETEGGMSDLVRDEICNLWKELSSSDGKVLCPLSLRAAGSGGDNGLCASNLGW